MQAQPVGAVGGPGELGEPALAPERVRASRRENPAAPARGARPAVARKEVQPAPLRSPRRREVQGIVLLTLGLFLFLSAVSLVFGDGKLMGPVGQWVAGAVYAGFGAGTLAIAAGLLVVAVRYLGGLPLRPSFRRACGVLSVSLAAAVLLHLGGATLRLHGMPLGGALGEYTAEVLVGLVGTAGTILVSLLGLFLALLLATEVSIQQGLLTATAALRRGLAHLVAHSKQALARREPPRQPASAAASGNGPADGIPALVTDYGDDRDQRPPTGALALLGRLPAQVKEQLTGRKALAAARAVPPTDKPAAPARGEQAGALASEGDNAPLIVQRRPPVAPGGPLRAAGASAGESAAPAHPAGPPPEAAASTKVTAQAPSAQRPATGLGAPAGLAAPAELAEDADTDAHAGSSELPSSPRSPFGAGPSEPAVAAADSSRAAPVRPGAAPRAAAQTSGPADRTALPVPELLGAAEAEAIDKTISQSDDTSPIVLLPPESKTADEVAAAVAIAEHRPAAPAAVSQPHYKPLSKTYEPPPLSLFDFEEQKQLEIDRKAMLDLAQRLESTLADYLVKGRVTAIHPGPVVTMYEFVPAPGTKLSKITALSSDLAMALEALRVRIVAPIPGKAAVGIEVPNRARETVFLKEVLADEVFLQAKSKLTMALGKDIAGTPVCVDLAKMPHLLVAGTTGSGKSVSVNGMVCSLLCNASPDDVKMIMIDPKMLELSIYEGIPHLLLPVVTDPKKANLALRWAVEEMERRYELISKSGVRDIGGYNKKVDKQILDIEQEQLDMFGDRDYDISDRPRKLPYIVVLIDEFADLMMVAAKEVEISVARIAQKARAAGIHLILATQRPSVDVITGLIKANFPSRIAFQVASRIDSRTILDAQGAENLLGMGDMLFTDRGQALRRIHGPLITDTEVHRVVEHLKQQGQPIYDMDILKPRLDEEEEAPEEDMHDDLYDQAVRLVAESRQASISMVQRRLRIGYNRAARMIERMEREGIVSAADGAKGREVLCQNL